MPKAPRSITSAVTFLSIALVFAFVAGWPTDACAESNVLTPTASISFTWRMRERFGDKTSSGLVDYHWNGSTQKYADDYVHPTSWTVEFDACQTVPAQSALRWEINGQLLTNTTCSFSHDFPALQTYAVSLTATSPDGQTQTASENITLRDLLIVSIGDSFAAGQGTPEKPRDGLHSARWVDEPCHRSSWSGPARAAIIIEKADPHSSVTFISFACTGAGLLNGFIEAQNQGGRLNKRQLEQIFTAAGDRTIDALLVSIGGNDVEFGTLVLRAISLPHAETNPKVRELFDKGMEKLPERFALMAGQLNNPNNKAKIVSVFITEYPDLVRDGTRKFCDHFGGLLEALRGISAAESDWALNTVIISLNAEIKAEAQRFGWNYVGGILDKFGGNPTEGVAHGFCAGDKRWVNTATDSLRFQRDKNGTVHPNSEGYLWYARRLTEEMRAKAVTAQ